MRLPVLLLAACGAFAQAPPESGAAALQGTTWQLVKFQGGDGKTLTPDDKTKYTIEFMPDGRVATRIDCNRGRGTWTVIRTGPTPVRCARAHTRHVPAQVAV